MKDLAIRVAGLFSEKPWKHDFPVKRNPFSHLPQCYLPCKKCGRRRMPEFEACHIPDPVNIHDLGPALECLRTISPDRITKEVMEKGFPHYNKQCNLRYNRAAFCDWIVWHATAAQIWEINVLAKEQEK